MKIETREIYKCEHCNKLYQIKRYAAYHEEMCFKNPKNHRPCFSCENLIKKETEIYSGVDDYYDSEPINIKREFFYCKSKKQFLYTPKNKIKGNFSHTDCDGGNFENYPMPDECNEYQEY